MFKSVRIQNFRQFKDLKLDNLAQINLITGANNTGKTSLLEALFLLDGPLDPSRTVVVARYRGVNEITPRTRELWSWLFRNGETSSPLILGADLQEGRHRSIEARLSRGSVIPAAHNGAARSSDPASFSLASTEPLPALDYGVQDGGQDIGLIQLAWTGQGLRLDPDIRPPKYQGFFLPEFHRPGRSEAVRYSHLEADGREGVVVDALRIIEPRLRQLRVLDFGEGARIHADLGRFPLIPISLMGQGFGKLLTIVAAMSLGEAAVYVIDEIGDGFHYSTLPDVWKVIISVAVQHSAQVFTTTHSLEAVNAAVEGTEGHEGSLAFYRLERRGDDIAVVQGEDFRLRAAVSVGTELR